MLSCTGIGMTECMACNVRRVADSYQSQFDAETHRIRTKYLQFTHRSATEQHAIKRQTQIKEMSWYAQRRTRGPLFLVHAHNIVLVDGLASNDSPEGIALLQHAAQLLLLALHLHMPLLELALQALLVTLHPQLQS